MDAMSKQGARTDLTSSQVGTKLRTDKQVAETADDSARQIQRYIRLTNLIPELLELVDEGKIALTPAVELSYLSEDQQYVLLGNIEEEDRTPSLSQAVRFKKLSQAGELTDEQIETIMQESKPNQKDYLKIPTENISKYFSSNLNDKQKQEFIIKALEHYSRYLERMRKNRGER